MESVRGGILWFIPTTGEGLQSCSMNCWTRRSQMMSMTNQYPDARGDLGISVIYRRIWVYYSDLETHFLDKAKLKSEDIALFGRCVIFLQTDLEYEGPSIRIGVAWPFGVKRSRLATSWWPFATPEQYRSTLARHPAG
jgi:hypothetical protein